MPLTPVDIHNREFGKASLGKRGYDEEDVDALLDEAGQEMIRLLEENDLLQRGAERDGLSAATAELGRARHSCEEAVRAAHLVQRQLDEARRSAADRGPADGGNPDGVLSLARRTADDHLQRADEESHALIADARDRSELMTREARERARDIEQDAGRHRTETTAAVRVRHDDLVREIGELSRFADDYRTALGESLLRQVDGITGQASAE